MPRLALILLLALTASAQTRDAESVRKWRGDLAYLRTELPARHVNPFHHITREEFHRLVDDLDARVPALQDHQLVVEVARVVHQLLGDRDGHGGVGLRPPSTNFHILPVNLFLYSDGLHVRAVSKRYPELAGAKVVSIGNLPADEAVRRAMTIASGDNDQSRRADAALILIIPEVLRALGIAGGDPAAPVEIRALRPNGSTVRATVEPLEKLDGQEWLDVRRMAETPPLYLRHADPNPFRWYAPAKNLWFEHFPKEKLLYVNYGGVADNSDETVAAFFARTFKFAEENAIDKFVVDLRHNGGGNNFLNRPFLHGMIKRDETIGRPGHFFVLIGRHTFSAAQNIVTQLEAHTNATFVGEPTGGSPNQFGDATRFTLPNSKLVVRVPTLWWQDAHPADPRLSIAPHIAADPTIADDRAGRDPALEAVLRYTPQPSLTQTLREALKSGDKAAVSAAYKKWRDAPHRKYASGENEANALGVALFGENVDHAVLVFEVNAEAYPQSWRAQESAGRAFEAVKRRDAALAAYERAIALNPKAPSPKERLDRLRKQP